MSELKITVTSPTGFPWDGVISLVPDLLWILALVAFFHWIGRNEIVTVLRRINKIGVAGVELVFRDEIIAALEAHSKKASIGDVDRASRRLTANAALVAGARILWVDDQPTNNKIEVRILETAGARIISSTTTESANQELARGHFDLIISDINRGSESDAGLKMAQSFAEKGIDTPVIFYVGTVEPPAPKAAFGITDRPDELLHLILDALARRRG